MNNIINFNNKYEVISLVAQTANNVEVYKCKSLSDGEIVMIKIFPKNNIKRDFFSNECNINNIVKDFSVAKIICKDETDDFYFLVMQAGSVTLLDYILTNGPIEEIKCLRMFKPIMQTIAFMHSRKILHNDVKLENIVMNGESLYLIDFGLSEILADAHSDKEVGTQNYTAPEVLQRRPHGTASDIYSLGVTLFAALTGEYPFDSNSMFDYYQAQIRGDFNSLVLEECGISLNTIILLKRMLNPKPELRPDAVECLLSGFTNLPENINNV